jgi:hypothetical protein
MASDMERVFEAAFPARSPEEPACGPGSTLDGSAAVRRALPALLRELRVRVLLDLPCGDFFWMREVDLAAAGVESYVGGDVVGDHVERNRRLHARPGVEFQRLDLTVDPLPRADLVLCRDCLVHLSFADVHRALANLRRSGSTFLLATTFPGRGVNADIETGLWRPLDLQAPPFALPRPLRVVDEEYYGAGGRFRDKSLGLWDLREIRR